MTTAVKVIFLDIDGVLNSERSCYAFGGFPLNFSSEHITRFDWVAVGLVRKACAQSGASIVLSSTWRLHFSVEEVARQLDLPIISSTPHLKCARGLEINAWLGEHPEVTRYVILDDDGDMLSEQRRFFVQTDPRAGVTADDYAQVLHLLSMKVSA